MPLNNDIKNQKINTAVMGIVTSQAHIKQVDYNKDFDWCDLQIDSLDLVEIIMDLEEAFSVEMNDIEYNTPADLITELNQQVKEL